MAERLEIINNGDSAAIVRDKINAAIQILNAVGISIDPESIESIEALKREVDELKVESYQFAIDVTEEDSYKLISYDKEQKPDLLCIRDDGEVIEVKTVYDSQEKRITVEWNERWKGKIYVR